MSEVMETTLQRMTILHDQCAQLEAEKERLETELRQKQARSEELSQAMSDDLVAHMALLEDCKKELRRLKRRIAKRQRFLKTQKKAARGRVVLDVGGTKFTTTLSTLGDSVLAALFYSRVEPDDDTFSDGAVFIDRDPQAFASILQWLRTGVIPTVKEQSELQTLLHEAAHYGLDQLVDEISRSYLGLHSESGSDEELDLGGTISDSTTSLPSLEGSTSIGGRADGCGWSRMRHEQFLDLVNRHSDSGLKFNGCDLRGFDFYAMDLRRANFHRCNLTRAELSKAQLDEAIFVDCCLRDANLEGASLRAADFTRADCRGANFANAVVKDTILTQADLRGTSLVHLESSPRPDVKGTELDSDL